MLLSEAAAFVLLAERRRGRVEAEVSLAASSLRRRFKVLYLLRPLPALPMRIFVSQLTPVA